MPAKIVGAGEFRTGGGEEEGLIQGVKLGPTRVRFSDANGLGLFEGDIILGRTADLRDARLRGQPRPMGAQGSVIKGQSYRWPRGRIPYEIDPGLQVPEQVKAAIAHWQERTKITFVARAPADRDYVVFRDGEGCSSWVGRQSGAQEITLEAGCSTGNAIHEIGHAVGLWHEQSRGDRDAFVTVRYENVDPAWAYNFDQHVADGDDVGPYDYGSIMHYPRTAFSRNGQDTLVPKDGQAIGQRLELSAGDVGAVRAIYPDLY